jgi:hypothetical protein
MAMTNQHRSKSRLGPIDKTAAVTKVSALEDKLFDAVGHLRRGVTQDKAKELLAQINTLRHKLGWLDLDLHHHPVWPAKPARQRPHRSPQPPNRAQPESDRQSSN